ncbi:MAG: alpha-galactosidase [Promethearchaeota archaeon]
MTREELARAEGRADVENGRLKVTVDSASGRYSIFRKRGESWEVVVRDATFGLKVGRERYLASSHYDTSVHEAPVWDRLGRGTRLQLRGEDPSGNLPPVWANLTVYDGREFVTVEVLGRNTTGRELDLAEVYTMVTSSTDGSGVFLGGDPSDYRVLEGGLGMTFDFTIRNLPGTEMVDSDWHVLVWDRKRRESLMMGTISPPGNCPQFSINDAGEPGSGVVDSTGRKAFPDFTQYTRFLPRKAWRPGSTVTGEVIAVNPLEADPHAQLEKYGKLIAEYCGVRLKESPVPAYWNSWNAPTGWSSEKDEDFGDAYGSMISEGDILDNMEVMRDHLQRFGMDWWGLDSGYATIGDWEPNERFPHGMKWLADQFHSRGLKAGIWINPFNADIRSNLFKDHPDWFLEISPEFPVKDKMWRTLDTTHPEVQDWLRDLTTKYTKDWGYDVLKLDFCYYVVGGKEFHDKSATGTEALRRGYQVIREAAGPDVFIIACGGPVGFYWGLADACRIGLDNMPRWGKDGEFMVEVQGILPSVRVMAGRYYLQNRVWVNHNDLIFFRPPLSWSEALSWATVYALSGSVLKIGDKLVQMKDEAFRVIQKMLPVYPKGARPVDLLVHQYPLVWDLAIDDVDLEPWHVVGLFNWGVNREFDEEWDEKARVVTLSFEDLGLNPSKSFAVFDFWEENLAGIYSGKYEVELEPRSCQLVAVREVLDRPQFLSTNRHFTQGATDIIALSWNPEPEDPELVLEAKVVGGFEHHYHFLVPANYSLLGASAGNTLVQAQAGELGHVVVKLEPSEAGVLELEIKFKKK